MEWFSKSDPFLRFFRPSDSYIGSKYADEIPENEWIFVKETDHVNSNLTPDFDPFKISSQKFCKNNPKCIMKLEIWDWENNGKHRKISKGYFTINDLSGEKKLTYIDTHDNNGKFSGRVLIENFIEKKIYSSTNLFRSGLKLRLTFSLDFTGTNGNQNEENSLHYISPDKNKMNNYEKSILSIGSILNFYGEKNKISILGFGARCPTLGQTSVNHCFSLNEIAKNPDPKNIKDVLKNYKSALPHLKFYGPTKFAPSIKKVISSAIKNLDKLVYHILIILTDGLPSDTIDTIDTIVDASGLPISIIIVGIGKEDFEGMKVLEKEDESFADSKEDMKRDILQFAHFDKFKYGNEELGQSVLKEIPQQISEYFMMKETNS